MSNGTRSADRALTVVLVCLHLLLRPWLASHPAGPDLLTAAVLLSGLSWRAGQAALFGFTAGVLEAALGVGGLGRLPLVYTLAGYLSARARDMVFADMWYFVFIYLLIGTWLTQICLALFAPPALTWRFALLVAPSSAVLTALLAGGASRLIEGLAR